MHLTTVDNYYQGKLSLNDIIRPFGEHRLVGYSLIYLGNAIFFGLNIILEPYIFLLTYIVIAIFLYLPYKKFFRAYFEKIDKRWIQISYASILLIIFSLVHPPEIFMATQFVIATFFFIITAYFFDLLARGKEGRKTLIFFIFFMLIYLLIFSGSYFGGALFSITFSLVYKKIFAENKKLNINIITGYLLTVFIIFVYLYFAKINTLDGMGLSNKVITFFSRINETSLSLIAGLSASTIDIHTFQEKIINDKYILLNGIALFSIGMYSLYQYTKNKLYKESYIPILLMMYSVGAIFTIRLGRLNGGWQWAMNEWYSFHLYFYLIGVLWILYYLIFQAFLEKNDLKVSKGKIITICIVFVSVLLIFSTSTFSSYYQWKRGSSVKIYLINKRNVLLNPTDSTIDQLLWAKKDTYKAIEILKKYKLSSYRD
ncbi:MAG: hypothetical protein PHU86_03880 [Patescibacteria group bacterium]|nr:hypothetical protein [Patescibacteria group bacterium]